MKKYIVTAEHRTTKELFIFDFDALEQAQEHFNEYIGTCNWRIKLCEQEGFYNTHYIILAEK